MRWWNPIRSRTQVNCQDKSRMAFKTFSVRSTPSGCSDYHYGICEALGGIRGAVPDATLEIDFLEIDSNDNTAVYSKGLR